MIILLDMDGVMVEHSAMFMRWLNRDNGTNHRYEDIAGFDYPNLSADERRQVMRYWHKRDLYDSHPPEPGCLEAIEDLRRRHRVVAVTSPMDGHVHSKFTWLRRTGGFAKKDIVIAGDKDLVGGDVLLDDRIRNLEEAAAKGREAVCYDRPWNQEWRGSRVGGWAEFVEHVDALADVAGAEDELRRAALSRGEA